MNPRAFPNPTALPFAKRCCSRGFTLVELLVVMGIIAMMLVALVPAVTSLSKSGGRRAARDSLLGGIEQARAEAIKSGQATYVVFPMFSNGMQFTLDRYNYRSYAIFEDNAASPGNVKQLTDWKSFPAGVALRAEVQAPAANVLLSVFEGYVNNGTEVATTKDGSGNPSAVEYLTVSQFTGRAEPVDAMPTPTATP